MPKNCCSGHDRMCPKCNASCCGVLCTACVTCCGVFACSQSKPSDPTEYQLVYHRSSQIDFNDAELPASIEEPTDVKGFVGHGGKGHHFNNSPDAAPRQGDSVIIVGAGAAGVHMASVLQERGINTIILEKSGRVGGKCFTVVHGNTPHEMGAVFLNPEFHLPKKLLNKYGLGAAIVPPGGPNGGIEVYTGHTAAHKAQHFNKFHDYMMAGIEEEWAGRDFMVIPNKISQAPFLKAIRRYQEKHQELFGQYYGTLPPRPTNLVWEKELNMTFLEWIKRNDLEAMIPLLEFGVSAQGYGYLDTLPAFYGLMWFTADLAHAYVEVQRDPSNTEPWLQMVKGGWSRLFENIVEQDQLDVKFNHEVKKIDRTENEVVVSGSCKVDDKDVDFEFKGTHVMIACPFVPIKDAFTHLTDVEADMIKNLIPFSLTTTLYECDPLEGHEKPIVFKPDNLSPHNKDRVAGEIFAEHWSAKCVYPDEEPPFECPTPPSIGNPFLSKSADKLKGHPYFPNKQIRVAYQFLDVGEGREDDQWLAGPMKDTLGEDLKEKLAKTVEANGATDVNVVTQFHWDHFFHYNQENLVKGHLWNTLACQGDKRTFYIGASAVFDSVNDVLNYNQTIIDHFFPKSACPISSRPIVMERSLTEEMPPEHDQQQESSCFCAVQSK